MIRIRLEALPVFAFALILSPFGLLAPAGLLVEGPDSVNDAIKSILQLDDPRPDSYALINIHKVFPHIIRIAIYSHIPVLQIGAWI